MSNDTKIINFPNDRIKRGPSPVHTDNVVTFPVVPRPESFDINDVSDEVLQDFFTQLMLPSEPGMLDFGEEMETIHGITIFDHGMFRPDEDNK